MTTNLLQNLIFDKKTFLSIGIDPNIEKLPSHLPKDINGVREFCENIISNTIDYCVSYKFNTAFFETLGWEGMKLMQELVKSVNQTHFIIADAKRGDIGNTSKMYAQAFFNQIEAAAITVAPYMGKDSILPFLDYPNNTTILLGLTSNSGAEDFELQKLENGKKLFQQVLETSSRWASEQNLMYVIGATQSQNMLEIRKIIPNHFLLIPGIGAQGGDLETTLNYLLTPKVSLLIANSREIIYASKEPDYASKSAEIAKKLSQKMWNFFQNKYSQN